MNEIIKRQIEIAQREIGVIEEKNISADRAFSHALLKFVFGKDYIDQIDLVTDGTNDGGIDFLYYDEDEAKVVLCQSKYTGGLSFDQVITELGKMYSTLQNFKCGNTGMYNEKLKKALQNALDQLPEENADNVEYNLFTIAPLDVSAAMRKIGNSRHLFPEEAVTIYTEDDIEKAIQRVQEALQTVSYEKVKIDAPKNYLKYESDDYEGIMCNVLSTSVTSLYNKYAGEGLFDLNIRRFIRSSLVDPGIKETLDSDRSNFWFLNNGIIIACKEFEVDGDTVRLTDFSIVNGGQTTTLMSTYKSLRTQEFYVPCKIVATKNNKEAATFFTKIAEATNSQKPIFARDLKSNAPEMVRLSRWLEQKKVYVEIKRGFKPKGTFKYQMKNDELGQILLSFTLQKPGTARSGKKGIFENQSTYDQIFKVNYEKDPKKSEFLLDLIDLNYRYQDVEAKFKKGGLDLTQTEILRNGKQIIFALLGVCYRLVNNDISERELLDNVKSLANIPFEYGKFLSNYKVDDLSQKLEQLIKDIVIIVADAYKIAFDNKKTSSVSNFMKTDSRYYNDIVTKFAQSFDFLRGEDAKAQMIILKR